MAKRTTKRTTTRRTSNKPAAKTTSRRGAPKRGSARRSAAASNAAGDDAVKICFERILPDELDFDARARRAMRGMMVERSLAPLDANGVEHVARMAVVLTKKWAAGSTLMCRFLDGSPKMKQKVEALAHQWEKHANIKFKFVTSGPAQIRISFFADRGSWSAVGRDALVTQVFPLHQPTMNFGWLRDDTPDVEYTRVVLHEFGHALGCIHEHQSPTFSRQWNGQQVLRHFSGPPNFWTPQQIEHNVLKKYSPQGIIATSFDPQSIMLYAFDGALFADHLGPTNTNNKLSPTDIAQIARLYPK